MALVVCESLMMKFGREKFMRPPSNFQSMDTAGLGEAEYLLYEVVRQNQRQGRDLPKTQFHKISFLTKKELENQGVEVPLPVYWYEHGIMVDLEEVVAQFLGFEPQRYGSRTGEKAIFEEDLSSSDFEVGKDKREEIKSTARTIARKFRDVFDTSVAKDKTYEEFADNDFIIHLNELRYFLESVEDVDTVAKDTYVPTDISYSDIVDDSTQTKTDAIDAGDEENIIEYLNKMTVSYPENKYTKMHSLFLEWESLMRQFTYNGMLSQLSQFTSEFWNTFSRVELRIHHNEDIPLLKVHNWKNERNEHINWFQSRIKERRDILLKQREETNELGSISQKYGEAVDEAVWGFQNQ